jgi:hypothetical protein
MDDTESCRALGLDELNVSFHVTEVVKVLTASVLSTVFYQLPDIDVLTLDIPTLVVIPCDEVRCDAFTLWPLADEVGNLVFHPMLVDVKLVEPGFSVNHVTALIDIGNTCVHEPVKQVVQDIVTLVLGAEVVVGREADAVLLLCGLPLVRRSHPIDTLSSMTSRTVCPA